MLTFSLGNKFAIFLMVVLVILGGVYSSAKLKLELLPDAENPVISVQTTMPGATKQPKMRLVLKLITKYDL